MNPLKHINFTQVANDYYHLLDKTKGNSKSISQKLSDFITSYCASPNALPDELACLNYLADNLKDIIIGDEIKLQDLTNEPKLRSELFWKGKEATPFGKEIYKKIFNYDQFRQSIKARKLAGKLKIKSCLYCNAAYCLSSKKKVYHTFDHFFSKRRYPYLSLSLYNLIPSCDNCNRVKSDKDISIRHPYSKDNSLAEEFTFRLEPSGVVRFKQTGSKDEDQIKIELLPHTETAQNHIGHFEIADQYSLHKDIAVELLWKSEVYTKSYRKDIIALFEKAEIKISEKELERFIVSNYTEVEDFHKRPLAKLMHDISKDLGLI